MGLSKEIVLTVKDYEIKLNRDIKFYENDTIDLCFSILEYGIEVKDGVAVNKLMPINALKAYMLIETPQGVDYAESTKVENNRVVFNLGNKYSQFIGIGKMQIVIKDNDGCRVTLPEFPFEIRQSINSNWDKDITVLSTEGNEIIIDEFGRKIELKKISEMEEANILPINSYSMILDNNENKKIKTNLITQKIENDLQLVNEQLETIESKKLDKTGIVTMANMGQDIKEAMTGGSVAVVGKNTVLTENIVDSQITPEKTTFFDIKNGNNILEPVIYKDGVYINLSGQEAANASYCVSKLIKVKPNTTYYAKGKTGYNPYGVFINEYTADEIWVKGKQLVTNDNNFTTGSTTAFINVSTVKEFVSVNNYPLSDICISTSSTLAYEPYFKKETIKITNLPILTTNIFGDIKVVSKTEGAEYNSITQAVNESNNGDVILILPGVYEDEKIKAWGKEIHLIGFSRENTVITNSTGTYTTPPIEIGRGSIENLTVHAKYGVSTDSNGWTCYAVHSEDNNLKDGKLTIRNCKLISEVNASFGLGMRGGCKIEIIDSDLVGIGTDGRALFFHDASSSSYAGLQEIDIIRCRLISNSSTNVTFRYNDQCVDGSSVKINIENTLIHNEAGSSYRIGTSNTDGGSYSGWRGLKNTTLSSKTYGNSMTL